MATIGDKLINLLDFSYDYEKQYLATLTDDERTATGTADDWSPKDVMAHVAYWDIQAAKVLIDPATYEPPDYGDDFNATNEEYWGKLKDASWDEIEGMVEKAHKELVAGVSGLDDEQLTDAERYEWTRGRPLWHRVCFGSFYHPMAHLGELVVKRGNGDIEEANAIQENAAAMQLELNDDDQWRGTVLYNLGCYYATSGQKELALRSVTEGLALYDYLKEWAPQDGDLASLRDEPAFLKALES